ncbi:MAG: sodium:alanine symporter family protein [Fusobacterium perfoetens]|uniref:alanine/glycine:cation symporter family protein n=1 Tax=Fusobacterium perfoetens TaxID=852 RepID=UPI0023F46958|nr:sodium:alanine symporter family protein [Fusobacterium perfoetens]MCI6153114.1 sodium:alanine symporter family protein [Fusobacterium perfoetens]MDY3236926.1 sodium:alanine symporter family protein [Fusobacterium perfoetens]
MENLNLLVQNVSGFVWNKILILLLIGTGVFFTIVLKFIQVRKFGEGYKRAVKGANLNGESAGADGMSSFQSLATAIAAQVGTGNLAGAATAIASGGPGAIFWMWVSAFFGMATVYAEAVLGQLYKKRVEGEIIGGPAYYISEGLGNNKFSKGLAVFFALSCVLALSFMGNAVQANSIASAFSNVFEVKPMYIGLLVAVVSGFIFWGGTQRIASFTEKIVPLMAGLYVGASILIMIFNFSEIIPAFKMIIMGAFNPSSVLGGAAGITVKEAVRYGVARGLFSNEAGMGSTPHAHAVAKVDDPSHQGAVAIITVFIDTFVVLNCTAFVIIMTGGVGSGLTGITLTQSAFNKVLGSWGGVFIAVCLFFFALSTIIGWYYFGVANIKYLFGEKGMNPYKIIVLLFIILGSMAKVDLVWNLSDLFNGLMALPNLVALIALYKLVKNVAIENKNK